MKFGKGSLRPVGSQTHFLIRKRLWNIWHAFNIIIKHPETLCGGFLSVISFASFLDKAASIPFGQLSSKVLEAYRDTFHAPFELLAKYMSINVPEPFRDLAIVWIAFSVLYARAYFTTRRLNEEYVDNWIDYTREKRKLHELPSVDQIPEQKTYYGLPGKFRAPVWKWLHQSYRWCVYTLGRINETAFGEKESRTPFLNAANRCVFVGCVALTLPVILISVIFFDDFLVVSRHIEDDINGDLVLRQINHRIVLSTRALFIAQTIAAGVACVLMANL